MTSVRAQAPSIGRMDVYTRALGKTANNMEQVSSTRLTRQKGQADGKTVETLNGLMIKRNEAIKNHSNISICIKN